jgi:hypothetical protein
VADGPADSGIRVDVAFVREAGTYRATIDSSGKVIGARTIADKSASCVALGKAVVASLVVLLDSAREVETPLPSEPVRTAETPPAGAAAVPPPPHAVDPSDMPPFDRRTGSADDAASPQKVRSDSPWYGWQIGVADAASALGMAVGWSANGWAGNALADISLAGFVAGGPVIHVVHRRPAGVVLGSLGLRVGLPIVGGIIGGLIAYAAEPPCKPSATGGLEAIGAGICQSLRGFDGVVVGMPLGALAASVTDVAFLGWDRRAQPRRSSGARVAPVLAWSSAQGAQRLSVGMGGVF